MAGSNILCTDYWLGQNAVPKSGYTAGTDDSRMMNVSEIMQKYQVTISTNIIPSRCPIQTEVNVTPKATIWTTYSVPYKNIMSVGLWVAVTVALGLVAMGLCFLFLKACEKI